VIWHEHRKHEHSSARHLQVLLEQRNGTRNIWRHQQRNQCWTVPSVSSSERWIGQRVAQFHQRGTGTSQPPAGRFGIVRHASPAETENLVFSLGWIQKRSHEKGPLFLLPIGQYARAAVLREPRDGRLYLLSANLHLPSGEPVILLRAYLLAGLLVHKAVQEEKMLEQKLPGYEAYAQSLEADSEAEAVRPSIGGRETCHGDAPSGPMVGLNLRITPGPVLSLAGSQTSAIALSMWEYQWV